MPASYPPSFTVDRMNHLAEIERWHFWFAGRSALLGHCLDSFPQNTTAPLADLGCGTGYNRELLEKHGLLAIGLEMLGAGLDVARQANPQAPLVCGDVQAIPFRSGSLQAVLLLDVLEHSDDQVALQEAWRVLQPAGLAFITVPAFPWLWSYRDQAAGHRRRYTRSLLGSRLQQAGFEVLTLIYYQFFLFPLVLFTRLFGRRGSGLRDLEESRLPLLNSLFTLINRTEIHLGQYLHMPWGSTLAAVCRKPV